MKAGMEPAARRICTHPFAWCEIHPDGSVFGCCPAWLKTPIGNLFEQSLAEIWNGPTARGLRRNILNGTFHNCSRKRCPRLASVAPPVMALAEVADPELRAALERGQVQLPFGPKILNLCFDPRCNLSCPTCRRSPVVLDAVGRERVALLARRIVEQAAPHAEELIVSGYGDPFGSPAYRELLTAITPRSWPRLRRVGLHTNGQLWDAAAWAGLAHLQPLVTAAEISIDAATAETYTENRRGGDFDRLLRNLDFIATLAIPLKFSCVIQRNNYRELPAFVDLARRYGAAVYFSRLVNWGTFDRAEFARRAVHLPDHPEHGELLAVLRQLDGLADVDLGNLRPLL